MLTRGSVGLILVGLIAACGPRLRHDAKPPDAADIPAAKMVVLVDPAKLDQTKKLAADGEFKVSGLFFKDGQSLDATVKVSLHAKDNAVFRDYVLDVNSVKGGAAKVDMWDDGTLTILVPDKDDPALGFETSNKNIKAAGVEFAASGTQSTCYLGKEILETQIRFALCDLGGEKPPTIHFVDAVPDAPAAEAPAAEAPAAAAPAAATPPK
jgi:hypothetical protein